MQKDCISVTIEYEKRESWKSKRTVDKFSEWVAGGRVGNALALEWKKDFFASRKKKHLARICVEIGKAQNPLVYMCWFHLEAFSLLWTVAEQAWLSQIFWLLYIILRQSRLTPSPRNQSTRCLTLLTRYCHHQGKHRLPWHFSEVLTGSVSCT